LARTRAVFETQLMARLEKVSSLADLMNHYRLMTGDADYIDKDLARYRALTPQGVQAAADKLLQRQARVVIMHCLARKCWLPRYSRPLQPLRAG
jgi:zinc protease